MKTSPENTAKERLYRQREKELEQALSERDKARADLERLSKESVAHKYTFQSLKDQISQLQSEKEGLEHQLRQMNHALKMSH